MSIESEADWAGLREVGAIVRRTLDALERHVRPGVRTGELDALARRLFAASGARSAPQIVYGFPGTVLISVNDEMVHGIPGSRSLEQGDLVKIDVTAEKDGFIADAARTVIVGGIRAGPPAGFVRPRRVPRGDGWPGRDPTASTKSGAPSTPACALTDCP